MSKTRKVEARVQEARHLRYRQAAEVLRMDELSDYVRRACDDLADRTLGNHNAAVRDLEKKQVTPRPRGGR